MRKDDTIRVRHMLEAAQEARSFAQNRTRDDLNNDRMLVLSLVKSIEIIGEAAAKITNESQQLSPEIPWPSIIAMRNRLVHAYFDIDLDRVWDTINDDLPPLISALEIMLQQKEA
jgi:uncharacterized protein with HEPN domain